MRIAAKLADRLAVVPADELTHILIKLRLLEKELIEELMWRPSVVVRQVIRTHNTVAIAIPAGHIDELSREPWVERVEEDQKVYALATEPGELIGAGAAWESGFTGRGIKLAIIDSGIDATHLDFSDRIVARKDFTLQGFKDNGHGSLVAGIAAGSGARSDDRYKGLAPDALIIAAKVLKADGTGRMSDVMAAIEWATDLGANIINLSLGTLEPSDGADLLCELCDRVVDTGVVVCCAAGNDGPNRRSIGSPAAARRALTVGAATINGLIAEFSSRGPTLDERLKPEIVAPGVDIVSTRAKGTKAGKQLDNYYTSATGTSMAAPHVAGLVALLLEANRKASPQLIRETLLHTAHDLELDDYAQGAGMIDAPAALHYIQTHENPPEPIDQSPPRSALLAILGKIFKTGARKERARRKVRRPRPRPEPSPKPFDDEGASILE